MSKTRPPASSLSSEHGKRLKDQKPSEPLSSITFIEGATTKELRKICASFNVPGCDGSLRVEELRDKVRSWILAEGEEDILWECSSWYPDQSSQLPRRAQPSPQEDGPLAADAQNVRRPLASAKKVLEKVLGVFERLKSKNPEYTMEKEVETGFTLVEALLAGMEFQSTIDPTPAEGTTAAIRPGSRSVTTYAEAAKKYGQQWEKIPRDVLQTIRSRKDEKRSSAFASLSELKPDSSEQAPRRIWEPVLDGYKNMKIERHAFKSELERALASKLHLEEDEARCVLFCSDRLPRGGFLVQLSAVAEKQFSSWTRESVSLETKGTWHRLPPAEGPTGFSIVLEGIGHEIPSEEVVEDVVYSNYSVHGLSPEAAKPLVKGALRLKRKNQEGDWVNCKTVRLFVDKKLGTLLLDTGGVFVNNLARHCRPYTPPSFRCLRCGDIGTHKAHACSKDPRCRYCKGAHMSQECPKKAAETANLDDSGSHGNKSVAPSNAPRNAKSRSPREDWSLDEPEPLSRDSMEEDPFSNITQRRDSGASRPERL